MVDRPRVIIMGGGIGGLTVAHELAEKGEFDIEIIEKNETCGGKARSYRIETDEGQLPAEHGLHFFPASETNLFRTLKKIPHSNSTVYDNLIDSTESEIVSEDSKPLPMYGGGFKGYSSFKEILRTFTSLNNALKPGELRFLASKLWEFGKTPKEQRSKYDELTWWEFIEAEKHSQTYQDIMGDYMTQGIVGVHSQEASASSMSKMVIQLGFDIINPFKDAHRVMNGPFQEQWMEPWTTYLEDQGVDIARSTEVKSIETDKGSLESVKIEKDGEEIVKTADYYVGALPIPALQESLDSDAIDSSKELSKIEEIRKAVSWINGVQIFLKEEISSNEGHVIYMESPWELTSICQSQFWDVPVSSENSDVEDVMSIIIADWEAEGDKVEKSARECTQEELKTEILYQINKAQTTQKNISRDIISSWCFDRNLEFAEDEHPKNNLEPLFMNNKGTWEERPSHNPDIENFFLAATYIQTSTDINSMESANEAGRLAANQILEEENYEKCVVEEHFNWKLFYPWNKIRKIKSKIQS